MTAAQFIIEFRVDEEEDYEENVHNDGPDSISHDSWHSSHNSIADQLAFSPTPQSTADIDKDDIVVIDDAVDDENIDIDTHTLLKRYATNNSISSYSSECNTKYASVEKVDLFATTNLQDNVNISENLESQWEALGDEMSQELQQFDIISEADLQEFVKEEAISDVKAENDSEQNETYFCSDCQHSFASFEEGNQHICFDHQLRHICVHCHAEFIDLSDLEEHAIKCEAKIPPKTHYNCNVCGDVLTSVHELVSHRRTHKRQPPKKTKEVEEHTVCHVCNTNFSSTKNLKLHMKIHNKRQLKSIQQALPIGAEQEYNQQDQFFCEICNKHFDHALLAVHQDMHQRTKDYNCGICNRKFESQHSYNLHMQMHIENTNKRVFPMRRSRSNEKFNFPCQYCDRTFLRPHEKVNHERIHTGEKPFECEVCGKTFRVSYSLTLHLRTHTDIRPYVCATCNKRFKSQPVYAHHLKTHQTERAYKCSECTKAFRTSVQLYAHQNSHKKPYNCPECNRPFASLFAVKTHIKTHTKANKSNENIRHECSACGAVYEREFALKMHIRDYHKGKPQLAEHQKQQKLCYNNILVDNALALEAVETAENVIYEGKNEEQNAILLAAANSNSASYGSYDVQLQQVVDTAKLNEEEEFESEIVITD